MKTPEVIKTEKKILEKDIEAKLCKRVKAEGGVIWKFTSPANRGVSDRIVLYKGVVVFVEVKRFDGKLTPNQESFIDTVIRNQGNAWIVYGMEGIEPFIEWLKGIAHA